MSERYVRCSECGMPHEISVRLCPATGQPVNRHPGSSSSMPVAQPYRPGARLSTPAPPRPDSVPPARPELASVDFELIGRVVGGKYRIREVLGEGGMGTVFEALHEPLGNFVAVKILRASQLQNRDAVRRFHQEARAAARIGHPNICEVYDVGSLDDGRPYLVMERLRGVTLANRIQALGGLPVQEVLDTLNQVLSALHAAHDKRIIHRDVKPENVFLTERVGCQPVAKILDFGVSKVIEQAVEAGGFSDVDSTRAGVVLGTPFYLSPEQAREDRNLDLRVDLYACGVLLYEALTGRRPFDAPNYHALVLAILTSTPRSVRELRPDVSPGLARVVERAMHRDPDERYQNALEFQAALQQHSAGFVPLGSSTSAPPALRGSALPMPSVSVEVPPAPPTPDPASFDEEIQALLRSAANEAASLEPRPEPRPPPVPPRASARVSPQPPPVAPGPARRPTPGPVARSPFLSTQRSSTGLTNRPPAAHLDKRTSPIPPPFADASDSGMEVDDAPTEITSLSPDEACSFAAAFGANKRAGPPRPVARSGKAGDVPSPPRSARAAEGPPTDARTTLVTYVPRMREGEVDEPLSADPNETVVQRVPLLRPSTPNDLPAADPNETIVQQVPLLRPAAREEDVASEGSETVVKQVPLLRPDRPAPPGGRPPPRR